MIKRGVEGNLLLLVPVTHVLYVLFITNYCFVRSALTPPIIARDYADGQRSEWLRKGYMPSFGRVEGHRRRTRPVVARNVSGR